MQVHDFIYDLEKQMVNELATRGTSKSTSGTSYNRIAYNIFQSVFPPDKFEKNTLETPGHRKDVALNYVYVKKGSKVSLDDKEVQDIIKKLEDPNLPLEERKQIEEIGINEIAHKEANNLARQIWVAVNNYVKKHSNENVTAQMVQSWILDPSNEKGKEILKKVRPNARIVGINGEAVTGWTKELWKTNSSKSKKDFYNKPEKEEVKEKEVEEYKGRSKISEENKKYFTSFIKKVIERAHRSGILKTISIPTPGQGGRTSGKDIGAYEFAFTTAIKPVIASIGYNFADIIVRALVEFEILEASKSEEESKKDVDLKSYANQIYKKVIEKVELTGISILPATVKNMINKWVKRASDNLEKSGFDDNLEKELAYYVNRLKSTEPGETFKLSGPVKRAISDTTSDIAADLSQNNEFIKSFTDVLIDSEEIKRVLRKYDPSIREKEKEIAKRKRSVVKKSDSRFSRISSAPPARTSVSRYSAFEKDQPEKKSVGESTISFREYLLKD